MQPDSHSLPQLRESVRAAMAAKNARKESDEALRRYLRVSSVAKMLDVGVSTVWRWVQQGKMPAPIRLSAKCTVWETSQVLAFCEAQKAAQL